MEEATVSDTERHSNDIKGAAEKSGLVTGARSYSGASGRGRGRGRERESKRAQERARDIIPHYSLTQCITSPCRALGKSNITVNSVLLVIKVTPKAILATQISQYHCHLQKVPNLLLNDPSLYKLSNRYLLLNDLSLVTV